MQVLQQLPSELERRNIGLVVLDSAAMLVRLEHDSRQFFERQQLLAEQASMLKQTAERFGIPVVVTNQVTGGGPEEQQRAALGVVWAHAVNTRLVMDQQGGVRRIRVCLSIASPLHRCTASSVWLLVPSGYLPFHRAFVHLITGRSRLHSHRCSRMKNEVLQSE